MVAPATGFSCEDAQRQQEHQPAAREPQALRGDHVPQKWPARGRRQGGALDGPGARGRRPAKHPQPKTLSKLQFKRKGMFELVFN